MEIIRENDKDFVRFTLRLLHLDMDKCDYITHNLDKNHIIYSCHNRNGMVNILINLEEIQDPTILINCINQINEKHDIYISIRSTYDHGGLDVPDNILNIIRAFKCDLNFSFFSS